MSSKYKTMTREEIEKEFPIGSLILTEGAPKIVVGYYPSISGFSETDMALRVINYGENRTLFVEVENVNRKIWHNIYA